MRFSKGWLIAAGTVWLALVAAGMKAAMDYESVPGPKTASPQRWPSDSRLVPPTRGPRLILFAHPRCSCTRATLEELAEIAARAPQRAEIEVRFYQPAGSPDDWSHTDLWRQAAKLPGTRVCTDEDGQEARRFGASTSGTVVLYDPQRRLVFRGGITPLRGQPGDNQGRQAVLSYLLHGQGEAVENPVFGCPLFNRTPP